MCVCVRETHTHIREAVEALDAANAALYWSFTQTDLYGESKTPQVSSEQQSTFSFAF